MKNFFLKFGFSINIGTTFLLLISYLAPFVPPDSFWPIAYFGLAYPYLVIINLIFLVFWIVQRSKFLLLSLISILLGINNFNNTFQVIPSTGSKTHGIKVLTYNVHSFKHELRSQQKGKPKVLAYFKSTGAEIICLQEATLNRNSRLSPQVLKDELPEINYYQQSSSGESSDLVTLSKYPIINHGEINFGGSANLVLFADIKLGNGKIVRVYNCHLQSYSIDPDDYSSMDSLGAVPNSRQIAEAKRISFKLKRGFKLRASQSRKLADHIRKSPYPVIVCGDFNDTPVSYAYRKVLGNLKDAFVEKGWGISNSYNGDLPSFRIDYILYDQKFTAENYSRDRVIFSDHFPVRCQIKVE